jgi:hypothetical protein
MHTSVPRPGRPARAAALVLFAAAAACGGDSDREMTVQPGEVDQKTEATPTERETAAFRAPADSVLTAEQVNAYLKTTLLQFDLIRAEAPAVHDRLAKIEERGQKGGVIAGLRNVADGVSLMASAGDMIGGSFVRSARSLGYNPAELEWVRERMGEVSAFMMTRSMYEASLGQARAVREQAEQYRGQEGFDEATIQQMVQAADEMEADAKREMQGARAVAANVEVLRRARPQVTDHMWASVALVGGAGGLMALTGLANPQDTTVQRQLEEWRRIYTDALENRVTPGLEAERAWGEARPRLEAETAANE